MQQLPRWQIRLGALSRFSQIRPAVAIRPHSPKPHCNPVKQEGLRNNCMLGGFGRRDLSHQLDPRPPSTGASKMAPATQHGADTEEEDAMTDLEKPNSEYFQPNHAIPGIHFLESTLDDLLLTPMRVYRS